MLAPTVAVAATTLYVSVDHISLSFPLGSFHHIEKCVLTDFQ